MKKHGKGKKSHCELGDGCQCEGSLFSAGNAEARRGKQRLLPWLSYAPAVRGHQHHKRGSAAAEAAGWMLFAREHGKKNTFNIENDHTDSPYMVSEQASHLLLA